jgi:hypothetical protein
MILGKKITSSVISPTPNGVSKIGSSTNHNGAIAVRLQKISTRS